MAERHESGGWWRRLRRAVASLWRWSLNERSAGPGDANSGDAYSADANSADAGRADPAPRSTSPNGLAAPGRAPREAEVRSAAEPIASPAQAEGTTAPARRFVAAMGAHSPRARVIAAFNAAQPVDDRYELLGRMAELNRLVDGVVERRQHALVFGARGSGKTSLARIFGDLADEADCVAVYHAATGDTDFVELLRPYLPFLTAEARPAGRPALVALAERHFTAREFVSAAVPALSRRLFLIVDEFDRIETPATKAQIASLLKLLADTRAPLQFLLVGIAADVDELLEAHPSLRRHLVAVPVRPFGPSAVAAVIDEGARRAGLVFPDDARETIAAVAAGSPYHVRLFCQAAGLAAVEADSAAVDAAALCAGLHASLEEWASVNARDSALFDRLCRRPELRDRLRAVAADAAAHQTFAAEGVPQALTPALAFGTAETAAFADTLAPQFLLARLHLATADRPFEVAAAE